MSIRKACITCGQEFTGDDVVCPGDGTILTPLAKDPYLGTLLAGRYDILEIIGGGGMGLVYKARHTMMNRIVAIKMLHQHLTNSTEALKRFKLEAEAASCLSLPNILTIYDFGVSDEGQPYMVMDYLEGTSLADVLEAETRLPVLRALNIFIQACAGLAHAHQKGVIHRDLKPSNIMLVNYADDQTDFVKIVDFGIAKLLNRADGNSANLTRTGEVYGSPLYMSPEQCRGQDLDARSDLYSFGCVMYKTLTGLPVFTGSEMIELLFKQVSETPKKFADCCPDADIPGELEKIVFTALQKDADNRYQSMGELKDVLETFKRKVEGRDTSDTGDYPISQIAGAETPSVPAAGGSSWAVQRPNGFGPGLVPGPLASALAHRAHEAGHHHHANLPPATGTASSAAPGAAARASAPLRDGGQTSQAPPEAKAQPPAPGKNAQPRPAISIEVQPPAIETKSPPEAKSPADVPSSSATGGNGSSEPITGEAGAWAASWAPSQKTSGPYSASAPPIVSNTDRDNVTAAAAPESPRRSTAEIAKSMKPVESKLGDQVPGQSSNAGKSDWLFMIKGIFANPMMIVAVVFVIVLGIAVVALYVGHHNTEGTPTVQPVDTTTDTTTESTTDTAKPPDNKPTAETTTATSTAQPTTEPPAKSPAQAGPDSSTTPTSSSPSTSTAATDKPVASPTIEKTEHASPIHPDQTDKVAKPKSEAPAKAKSETPAKAHGAPPVKLDSSGGESEETPAAGGKGAHKHHTSHHSAPTSVHGNHRHAYSSYEF